MKLISNRFLEKENWGNIAIIKKLVKDNPARVDDINELSKLVDHRFDLFRRLCYCQKQNFDREKFYAKLQESNDFTEWKHLSTKR
jgi:hypothetical protein